MFTTEAFFILTLTCIIATLIAVPRQVKVLQGLGLPIPAPPAMMVAQSIILSILAAGLGAAFAGRVGLSISNADQEIVTQLVAGIVAAAFLILGVLVIYYGIFRPRMPAQEVILSERLRLEMGILVRVLYGGLVEEVQFRWGLMSLIAWIGLLLAPDRSNLPLWIAVVLSALVFAYYHFLGARQLGTNPSPPSTWTIMVLNLWSGLIFGGVFLRFGLLAAMIAHASAHIIWHSFEGILLERYETKIRTT